MSRTIRRKNKTLALQSYGTLDENLSDPHHLMTHYPRVPLVLAYRMRLARYHRDRPSGVYGAPREFRHQRFNDRLRRAYRDDIRRCMRNDYWEDHRVSGDPRGARSLFHWIDS